MIKLNVGLGALVQFDNIDQEKPLITRVGISFVSEAQACASAEDEVPEFDFDLTHMAAKKAWEDTLSKISVDGGTEDDKVLFYSSVGIFSFLMCIHAMNTMFTLQVAVVPTLYLAC